ncbi:MAG: hypothetical protein IH988_03415 [Planctomycetes bacterium]|nr:hypothetical protein [Planctomycetota bacterium]
MALGAPVQRPGGIGRTRTGTARAENESLLAESSIWAPFIYQYTVGGLFFALGIYTVLKSRAVDLSRRSERRWLTILFVGLVLYFCAHLGIYLAAIYILPVEAP